LYCHVPPLKATSVMRERASVTIEFAFAGLYGYAASRDAKNTGFRAYSGVWELSTAVMGNAVPP